MTKSLSTEGGWWAEFTPGGVIQHEIGAETNGFVVGYDPMNGEVKGVEVPTCVQRMELQYKVPVLTMGYLKKLKSYSNHTNSEVFLGQPIGAVKMVGANVQWSNANGYTVRIVLDIGTNQVRVRVSDDLPTTDVKAWQYLDVKYLPKPDTNSPSGVSSTVIGYIVHNVLETADLNDIFT
jgi:hypothetical protein